MMEETWSLPLGRLLQLVAPKDLRIALAGHCEGKLVALLSSHSSNDTTSALAQAEALLNAGCTYFVCHGEFGEELHDAIDDLVLWREEASPVHGCAPLVMTTWHHEETAEEIAYYFVDLAGSKPGTHLIAVIGAQDQAMAEALLRQVMS